MEETVVTREGLARLRAELERLTTVERRGIAERLKHAAASEANRAENGDYVDARAEYDRAIELAGNTAETAHLTRRRDQLG